MSHHELNSNSREWSRTETVDDSIRKNNEAIPRGGGSSFERMVSFMCAGLGSP